MFTLFSFKIDFNKHVTTLLSKYIRNHDLQKIQQNKNATTNENKSKEETIHLEKNDTINADFRNNRFVKKKSIRIGQLL